MGTERKRTVSSGVCQFCDAQVAKTAIARHLKACEKRPAGQEGRFHLVVEGRGAPEFWLHLDASGKATLAHLDGFLRSTWLECCGHLSAFTIEGTEYESNPEPGSRGMRPALEKVLASGMKFRYVYDYGSSTELTLRVLGDSNAPKNEDRVRLLARSVLPDYQCECGAKATKIYTECMWSGQALYCDACLEDDDCGEEMALPIVNSPRAGVCGYTG
ncbi:MAG: hypothetical protein FJZ01_17870 [Candidatus Sericytochromatia bacterium]|nr:hypothetical protein [Candidatus Tanganyikabacteria bacterium]